MLVEIVCEKFKQKRIIFKEGLNVILGDDNATNSIGKSSFLLVIDFVFGGNTYNTTTDIISHVGNHTVCFCFSFNSKKYYFKRDTAEAATVHVCDNEYNITKDITNGEFQEFLKDSYDINIEDLSWRQLVGLYMRIYGKPNLKETEPLFNKGTQQSKDVQNLLKTFDKFEECSSQFKIKEEASNKFSAFQKAQSYKIIDPIKNKTEIKQLDRKLIELQSQSDNLMSELETNTIDLTSEQLQAIADLKSQLNNIQITKSKRIVRLNKLKKDVSNIVDEFNVDKANILRFFPNINIREIEKINTFHKQLTTILSSEIKDEIEKGIKQVQELESVEKELLEKIKDVIKTTEPQKLSLNRFVHLQNEINSLIRGKDVYNLRNKYKEEKANATKLYEEILQDSLTEVQQLLNNEINRRNDDVFNGSVKSPLITLRPKSYKYSCSDDNGTGSNYKNLILFDLSVLSLTCLPTLIHDTVLFKNIAVDVLEKLILQYNSFASKQIFISFDNLSNFSERTSEVLRDGKVLELTPGGNELYGFSWNKKM